MTQQKILSNRYEVQARIGRGGMADVFRGRDTRLGREVAIKVLRADMARDPMVQSRFRREAQAVAALNHPAIVAVYDTGEDRAPEDLTGDAPVSVPFIVMEFVEGRTLRDLLSSGEITVDKAIDYTLGVLAALTYSHGKSIVHRDIKPANVMVTPDGSVKVMDFGIARALADASATMTQTQAVIGTAQYLSPEQARGEAVDVRSDLYSAGCLLFELLTGRPPFVGDSPVSVAYQHVGETAPSPSALNAEVPAALDAVLATALQKDREDRFPSAEAFAHALRAARHGHPAVDPEATQLHPAVAAGAAAGAASVAASDYATTDAHTEAISVPADATAALPASYAHAATPAEAHTDPHPSGVLMYDDGTRLGDIPHPGNGAGESRDRTEPERKSRGWIVVLTLLIVAALAGGGAFVWNWQQQVQAANAQVTVPSVKGLSPTAAQDAIVREGLTVKGLSEEFSDEVEKGQVIGTQPGDGESVKVNTGVEILVSKGPSSATIPDLEGATESTARATLEGLGLVVNTEMREENSATIPKDRVVSTNPAIGDSVAAGSTVELTLSTGMVTVPDLMTEGLTVEQASDLVSDPAVGLELRIIEETNSVLPPGTITGQNPAAGENQVQGGAVEITVATEPAPESTEATPEPSETDSSDTDSEEPDPSSTAPGSSGEAQGRNGNGNGKSKND